MGEMQSVMDGIVPAVGCAVLRQSMCNFYSTGLFHTLAQKPAAVVCETTPTALDATDHLTALHNHAEVQLT